MEELKKFFLEEGFDLPWWFETTAEQAILDIHIEDECSDLSIQTQEEEHSNVGDCGDGQCSEVEPVKPPKKKKKGIFQIILDIIVGLFNTKLDIKKRAVNLNDYSDIPDKDIAKLNSITVSVRPQTPEAEKLNGTYAFFTFIRNLTYLKRQMDVVYPDQVMYEVYKRSLILDNRKGNLNILNPTLESIVEAALDLELAEITVVETTSISALKREMHRHQIAIAQLDTPTIIYGFNADSWFVFKDGKYQKLTMEQFEQEFKFSYSTEEEESE